MQDISTLLLCASGGGGGVAGNSIIGTYYVSKSYVGASDIRILGYTLADVGIAYCGNPNYVIQFDKAQPGSMLLTYPDPWSARNAALDAIAANEIEFAEIRTLSGEFTVGGLYSSDNGDILGNAATNTVADIQFNLLTLLDDYRVASLPQDKLKYYFEENTGITYINNDSIIPFGYEVDLDDVAWNCDFITKSYIRQVYGEVNGFAPIFCRINNARARFKLEIKELTIQQYTGFDLVNIAEFDFKLDKNLSTDTNMFSFGSTREGDGDTVNISISITNNVFGEGLTPYPDETDWWYHVTIGNNTSTRKKQIQITNENCVCNISPTSLFYIPSGASSGCSNMNFTWNIRNLEQTDSGINSSGTVNTSALLSFIGYYYNTYENNVFTFNIDDAKTESPLICSSSNLGVGTFNYININVGTHEKIETALAYRQTGNIALFDLPFGLGDDLPKLTIKGIFINYQSEVITHDRTSNAGNVTSCMVTFMGKYVTNGLECPVASINSRSDKRISFIDCILINDGETEIIANNYSLVNSGFLSQTFPTRNLYFKNVHTNSITSLEIIQNGEPVVENSELINFM